MHWRCFGCIITITGRNFFIYTCILPHYYHQIMIHGDWVVVWACIFFKCSPRWSSYEPTTSSSKTCIIKGSCYFQKTLIIIMGIKPPSTGVLHVLPMLSFVLMTILWGGHHYSIRQMKTLRYKKGKIHHLSQRRFWTPANVVCKFNILNN